MKHKPKTILGTVGLAAVFLLAGSIPHHLPAKAPVAPYSRPVYDLRRGAEAVSLSTPQADCAANVPATSESVPVANDTVPASRCAQAPSNPEPVVALIPQEVSSPAPAQREQQAHEKTSPSKGITPQMGDTRIVDGQKQVYFLGFGWIDDNGGGGIIVDGDGVINKMVGDM